jgi:hypothetical protein
MEILGSILSIVGGIGSLVCWIIVLIRMFKTAGVLQGIIGIICALWAFIWGWINSGAQNLRNVMLAWTGCIVLSVIGGGLSGAGAASQLGFNVSELLPLVSVMAAALGLVF